MNPEYTLLDIEPGTIITYFLTEKAETTDNMEKLNAKFPFMVQNRNASNRLGDVVKYDKTKDYVLYGCVVRRTLKDPFDFESFQKCLTQINKFNRQDLYEYVGITEESDKLLHEQILTVMKTILRKVDIYVCKSSTNKNDVEKT